MANGVPLLQNSVALRVEAGPNYGEHDINLIQLFNSIQADLQNIINYLGTHQHSALNAAPSTGTYGSTTATGAQLISNSPAAPVAVPASLYTQP